MGRGDLIGQERVPLDGQACKPCAQEAVDNPRVKGVLLRDLDWGRDWEGKYCFASLYPNLVLGADTPFYLATLPESATAPNGEFISERQIVNVNEKS